MQMMSNYGSGLANNPYMVKGILIAEGKAPDPNTIDMQSVLENHLGFRVYDFGVATASSFEKETQAYPLLHQYYANTLLFPMNTMIPALAWMTNSGRSFAIPTIRFKKVPAENAETLLPTVLGVMSRQAASAKYAGMTANVGANSISSLAWCGDAATSLRVPTEDPDRVQICEWEFARPFIPTSIYMRFAGPKSLMYTASAGARYEVFINGNWELIATNGAAAVNKEWKPTGSAIGKPMGKMRLTISSAFTNNVQYCLEDFQFFGSFVDGDRTVPTDMHGILPMNFANSETENSVHYSPIPNWLGTARSLYRRPGVVQQVGVIPMTTDYAAQDDALLVSNRGSCVFLTMSVPPFKHKLASAFKLEISQ